MFSLISGTKEKKNNLELQAVVWQLFFWTGNCSLPSMLRFRKQDIFLNINLDMYHMLAKLRNAKKIFFLTFSSSDQWKILHWLQRSYHLIPGNIHSLTSVLNIIFIVLIKFHNGKNVSCFLMVFCLKLLFEDMRFWAILDKACLVGKFVDSVCLKILSLHFVHKSSEIFPL